MLVFADLVANPTIIGIDNKADATAGLWVLGALIAGVALATIDLIRNAVRSIIAERRSKSHTSIYPEELNRKRE